MKIEREGEVKKVYIFYLGTDSTHRHALSRFVASEGLWLKGGHCACARKWKVAEQSHLWRLRNAWVSAQISLAEQHEPTSYNHGGRLYSGHLSLAKERGFG